MPDILKQLEAANARLLDVEADNKVQLASVSRLTQELADSKAETTKLTGQIAALTSERDGAIKVHSDFLAADHATALKKVTDLEAETKTLKDEAKTAEQLALERTGKGGNEGVKGGGESKVSTPGNPMNAADAFAEYNGIKDPKARGEYYSAHKALMFPPKTA
jgi:hypothetical protein